MRHATAPINVQWGWDNRTTGFRVPEAAPHERHVENRVIGADANPYLALAVTLACGYLGMSGQCKPSAPTCGSAQALDFELPQGLPEALRLLRGHDAARRAGRTLRRRLRRHQGPRASRIHDRHQSLGSASTCCCMCKGVGVP
ncbi:glutamine synthetase [Massilia sp. B-10]|nr:glutamine synthetase [Massilia sp. B-10]